jgi:hypothetical protein
MWSKTFHLFFFLRSLRDQNIRLFFFQMTSNVDVVYTRFVALDAIYNFVFENHFILDCLEPNISILSYTKIVVGLVLAEI